MTADVKALVERLRLGNTSDGLKAADALARQEREIETLREALMDQIRATAFGKLGRPDAVALVEQRGELIAKYASPSAARALTSSPSDQPGGAT